MQYLSWRLFYCLTWFLLAAAQTAAEQSQSNTPIVADENGTWYINSTEELDIILSNDAYQEYQWWFLDGEFHSS